MSLDQRGIDIGMHKDENSAKKKYIVQNERIYASTSVTILVSRLKNRKHMGSYRFCFFYLRIYE